MSEDGRVRIGATLACLTRLHSHFMAEWKPGRSRPKIGNRFSKSRDGWDQKRGSVLCASSRPAALQGAAVALRILLVVPQATPATLLCSAARECLFRGKILRDIFIRVRLMCPDNREGRKKSALLRGQSLGRMRSRRGYSLPPETGNRSDAFKLQGLVPCIFFVQSPA